MVLKIKVAHDVTKYRDLRFKSIKVLMQSDSLLCLRNNSKTGTVISKIKAVQF